MRSTRPAGYGAATRSGRRHLIWRLSAGAILVIAAAALGLGGLSGGRSTPRAVARVLPCGGGDGCATVLRGIHKIRHVVIIMQENRSFDTYFGTYPGADGIPMRTASGPGRACRTRNAGDCVSRFHTTADENLGGPHEANAATGDIDGGKMDGFINQAEHGRQHLPRQPQLARLRRRRAIPTT